MWPDPTSDDLRLLQNSPQFDPGWYLETYRDVSRTGLSPAAHYLSYGFRIGRDPGPSFSTLFHQAAFASRIGGKDPVTALLRQQDAQGDMPPADPERVLYAAHLVFLKGEYERALTLAKRHLSPAYQHTLNILNANIAHRHGDRAGWNVALNAYLAHFRASPVQLRKQTELPFNALHSPPPAPVTDGPLISVIMPVHNASRWIGKAVRSVLTQSWRNIEVIAIDDASTDTTSAILSRIAAEDSRLQLRRLPVNAGPYVARNVALTMAKGAWITCHDGDDWALPQRLEQHMKAARPDALPASLTCMIRMQPEGLFDTITPADNFSLDGVTRRSSVSTLFHGAFLRDRLGYWDTVRVDGDTEMIARAGRLMGRDVPVLQQVGMICLSTEQGLTRDPVLGILTNGRSSPLRARYKKIWGALHKSLPPEHLYLPFPQTARRYQGDFKFAVPQEDVYRICAS